MSKNKTLFMLITVTTVVFLCAGIAYLSVPEYGGKDVVFALENNATASSVEGHDDHEGEKGHDDHEGEKGDDGHDAHAEEGHSDAMTLTLAEMEELSISLAEVGPGKLDIQVRLPGEVRLNEDRLAHVVPKLSGIVKEVRTTLGDAVQAGDVMAILESRDLATAKAAYLAATEHASLARATFSREEELWKEQISAEKDYLEAKNARAGARIAMRTAEQQLEALGLSDSDIASLTQQSGRSLTRYEVLAPFEGSVIEKHIALGEFVEANADVFTLANLTTVWVDLSVYSKDLSSVRKGQKVIISTDSALPDAEGLISYIGPVVGEETRTALARVVLPNPDGLWRPGMFVTAKVAVEELAVAIKIPKTALQTIEGKVHVFVQDSDGLEAVEVTLGRVDQDGAEVLSGLEPGQQYVATGGFYLKAELGKEAFAGGGHNH